MSLKMLTRVHAHQHRLRRRDVALHQRDVFGIFERVDVDASSSTCRHCGSRTVASTVRLHEVIVFAAIGDEIGDGADLQAVQLRERHEIGHARHRAVVVHDLADHAGRIEPGEPRDIDGGFGVAGAHQRAAVARDQRKDVARR